MVQGKAVLFLPLFVACLWLLYFPSIITKCACSCIVCTLHFCHQKQQNPAAHAASWIKKGTLKVWCNPSFTEIAEVLDHAIANHYDEPNRSTALFVLPDWPGYHKWWTVTCIIVWDIAQPAPNYSRHDQLETGSEESWRQPNGEFAW